MGKIIPSICKERPYKNPRSRYGKGFYKYTLKKDRVARHKRKKRRPQHQETRKRYKRKQGKKPKLKRWASSHKLQPILEPSFSNYFDLNYNQFDHYSDTILN